MKYFNMIGLLQKWRSERDKLVGQLQEILVKKDEEITSLKEKSPERHETLSDVSSVYCCKIICNHLL